MEVIRRGLSLVVALGASAVLIGTPPAAPAVDPWTRAQRSDVPGFLSDGPLFAPLLFLDVRTAVGTAPTPDGRFLRLLIRNGDGSVRVLRKLPLDSDPAFDTVTASGPDLIWTEWSGSGPRSIWAASGSAAPRQVTADTGEALFFGSQYDLVVTGRVVRWVAAADAGANTEVRSVPLTGGSVKVRPVRDKWALSAWPWLTDGTGTLLNLATGVSLRAPGECSPAWCRVAGPDGVDLKHPDGTSPHHLPGAAAVTDVALLDRFELLSRPGPQSGLTGTAPLFVCDLRTGRTVGLTTAASSANARGGMAWWSTGPPDDPAWHALDLRTV